MGPLSPLSHQKTPAAEAVDGERRERHTLEVAPRIIQSEQRLLAGVLV